MSIFSTKGKIIGQAFWWTQLDLCWYSLCLHLCLFWAWLPSFDSSVKLIRSCQDTWFGRQLLLIRFRTFTWSAYQLKLATCSWWSEPTCNAWLLQRFTNNPWFIGSKRFLIYNNKVTLDIAGLDINSPDFQILVQVIFQVLSNKIPRFYYALQSVEPN